MDKDLNIKAYDKLIEEYPVLSKKEEREAALSKDYELLVCSNIRLANKFTFRYWNLYEGFNMGSLSLTDCMQESIVAISMAAKSFNPDKGSFSTWAVKYMQSRLTKFIIGKGSAFYIPAHIVEHIVAISNAQNRIILKKHTNRRGVSIEDVSSEINMPEEKIKFLLTLKKTMLTTIPLAYRFLEEESGQKDTPQEFSSFKNVKQAISKEEEEFQKMVLQQDLETYLTPREFDVIWNYFGFPGEEHSLVEIGRGWGRARERARQIKEEALVKLRKHSSL